MKARYTPLILVTLSLAACGSSEPTEAPGRRVPISVTSSGYEPAQISATAGERLTLVVTRTSEEGCGEVFVIPSHDIREALPLNEAVEVSFTPTEPGELRFTCGMDMYDGAIVVTQ